MGLAGGNINFFICTYMMCLETINLSNADQAGTSHADSGAVSEGETSSQDSDSHEEDPFLLWPFHAGVAIKKLKRLGAGPWPYIASVIYLIGVLVFTVGIAVDIMTFIPEKVADPLSSIASLIGSIMFAMGGFAECIENSVFTTCTWDHAYIGALLNFLGGVGFVIGAVLAFFPGQSFEANFWYGVGSVIYALGSAFLIYMWKDEQFGLTFLAVLNNLGGPDGHLLVMPEDSKKSEESEQLNMPSRRTALFIMVYATLGVVSFYDVCITLANVPGLRMGVVIANALNCFWPCIFAHFMLVLNSGVYRTPKLSPFRWLYLACRYVAVLMLLNQSVRLAESLHLLDRLWGLF